MDRASLDLLIMLATSARDDAARAHARRAKALEQARRQYDTLMDYVRDYRGRAHDRLTGGLDAAAAANQRAFLVRLDEAIQAQHNEIAVRTTDAATSAAALGEEGRKLERFKLLRTRRDLAAVELAGQRDQKLMDELAQRARPGGVGNEGIGGAGDGAHAPPDRSGELAARDRQAILDARPRAATARVQPPSGAPR
jgi:flagellar export protein FliJ